MSIESKPSLTPPAPTRDSSEGHARAGAGRTTEGLTTRPTTERRRVAPLQASGAGPIAALPWHGAYDDCWALMSGHPMQARSEGGGDLAGGDVQQVAARGVAGAGAALPHLDAIQRSFGDHDLGAVRAHVGGDAAVAAQAIGATAYATGVDVAFASAPDLHLAAHEAAHVVQQRAGVHLRGGVGAAGDAYEQHADAVADRVVAGLPATDLLAALPRGQLGTANVQRKGAQGAKQEPTDRAAAGLAQPSKESAALSAAWNDLNSAELEARDVLRDVEQGHQLLEAYQRMTTILQRMLRPLGVFMQAGARARSDKEASVPWAEPTEEGRAFDIDRDKAAAAVNNTVRVALIMEQRQSQQAAMAGGRFTAALRGPEEAAIANVQATRGAVAAVATQIGWKVPSTVAEADAARYEHEACPPGGKEERGSALCKFDDAERVDQRRRLDKAVTAAVTSFGAACKKHVAVLDKAIATRKESSDLLIDLFSKSIGVAVDVAAPGLGKVASAAIEVTLEYGADYAKEQAGEAATDSDPRTKTKGMLAGLLESMTKRLTEASMYSERLDDNQLVIAVSQVNKLDKAFFATRLDPLVASYRAQIEPLGRGVTEGTPFGFPSVTTKYKNVKVQIGSKTRFAQVADEGRDPDGTQILLGHDQPQHAYTFMRWINPEFEPMVDESPTLDPGQINGLPLGTVTGTDGP